MPIIPLYLKRPTAILKIPDAIARGLSAQGFIRELKGLGISYRRTEMLKDWRSVASIEAKKDLVKYVRRDRIPSAKIVADVEWKYSKEYIYKVNTWSRTRPDEPITERMVTFVSDVPMTPSEVEEQIAEKWVTYERYVPEKLERARVSAVYHRIESPLEEE